VQIRPAPAAAQVIEWAVHHDACEPGAKVGSPFEPLQVQVVVQQAVLGDIVCVLFVPGDPQGEVGHRFPMALDERQKRRHNKNLPIR
jgi:hypothetical protein